MDIATDIATLLLGVTTDIFNDALPESPDNCIALYQDGGFDPVHTFGTQAPVWEKPAIQVVVRHTIRQTAISWIESIKDALDGKTSFIINTHYYMSCFQRGDVQSLGRDKNKRIRLGLNFLLEVTR